MTDQKGTGGSKIKTVQIDGGRRNFLTTAGAAAAGGLIGGSLMRSVAWAASHSDMVAAAQAEGKVMLYTGSAEPLIIALGEAFSAEYGIQVEYQRVNSGAIAQRFTAESEAGQNIADVLVAGDPLLFKAFRDKGWLADLDEAEVPSAANYGAEFKTDYSVVSSINPHTMGVNTQLVSDLPTSWQDMLRPELKGKMITVDLRSIGLVAFGAFDMMMTTYGEDFLRELGQQDWLIGSGGPASIQQVAAGGASLFFPCSTTQAFSVIEKGAPVEAVIPEGEPYTGVISPVSISATAPHPNAARLLTDFILSEKGQSLINADVVSPIGAPGTQELRPGFVPPNMDSAEANREKIVELILPGK